MTPQARREALRELAAELDGIDVDVYEALGRDPLEPVLGGGDPDCRIAFFGRDPGRDEVRHQEPFIGKGGQLIRGVLHEIIEGEPPPDEACVRKSSSENLAADGFWQDAPNLGEAEEL